MNNAELYMEYEYREDLQHLHDLREDTGKPTKSIGLNC